jgi:hypothetical protein
MRASEKLPSRKRATFGQSKVQKGLCHQGGRQDIIPAGCYPVTIVDSLLIDSPRRNVQWYLWFKLRDHKVTVRQDFHFSGTRIMELQAALDFHVADISDEETSPLLGRVCRLELKVSSNNPRYRIVHVLAPEQTQP